MRPTVLALACLALGAASMVPVAQAKVFHENTDDLPPGCDAIAGDAELTVQGGREFAADFPDSVFVFDERVFDYDPCTRLTVTFANKDDVRHQWMIHGVWPEGVFVLEAEGGAQETGTVILPAQQGTLLVHCGLPQHQQKGMKGEILMAGGAGHLPNIPGVSGRRDVTDADLAQQDVDDAAAGGLIVALAAVGVALLRRRRAA